MNQKGCRPSGFESEKKNTEFTEINELHVIKREFRKDRREKSYKNCKEYHGNLIFMISIEQETDGQ